MGKIFTLLLISSFFTFAQNSPSKGDFFQKKAHESYIKGDYKLSMLDFLTAIKYYEIAKDSGNVLRCFSEFYGNASLADESKEYLKYENKINLYAKFNDKLAVYNLLSLGQLYRGQGDFDIARKYFEKAESKYQQITNKNHRLRALIFLNLGNLSTDEGDFQQSINYYKQCLNEFNLCEKIDIVVDEVASAKLKLANSLAKMNFYEEANRYYLEAKMLATQPIVLGNIQNGQIEIFKQTALNKPDLAKKLIDATFKLQTENKFQNKLGNTYRQFGEWLYDRQQYEAAIDTIKQGIILQKTVKDNLNTGKSYHLLANIFASKGDFSESLNYFQKSLETFSDGFVSKNFSQNPSIGQVRFKKECLLALTDKLKILLKFNPKTNLNAALSTAQLADQLIDYQRNNFQLEGSKLFLINLSHQIYGLAIDAAYQKYEATKNEVYLDQAFRFSEKNKSVVLFEAVKATQNQNHEGVPQTLTQQDYKLHKRISVFENLIYRDEKKKPSQVAEWRNRLLKASQDLEKLKELFKDDYPEYYKYKYDTEPISPKEIQEKLSNNQALIEYFIDKNSLFIFLITSKKSYFLKQNLPADFKQNIVAFKNEIIRNSVSSNYVNLSLKIYNTLFSENINKILTEKIANIEIVADGELNYIPFESLLVRQPHSLKESNIYLLEKLTIGYLPSATMNWKNTIPKTDKSLSLKYLGFAPSYEKGSDLPYNQVNVSFLSNLFSGKSFLKASATKQTFDEQSPNRTNILHLSMHAGASPTDPMESYLAFEKDSLFVHDIYARSIPAELSILDACETGVGILNNGEGVMNLSRAFLHAGSQSVAMSLWKLTSSPETSEIIRDFVTLVENGKPKDEALRTAKLNYLNKYRKDLVLSHPFYWSPLILVGNPSPIAETSYFWWIFGGIGLILIAFLLVKNRKYFFQKFLRKTI